jgi:hypothetical protein
MSVHHPVIIILDVMIGVPHPPSQHRSGWVSVIGNLQEYVGVTRQIGCAPTRQVVPGQFSPGRIDQLGMSGQVLANIRPPLSHSRQRRDGPGGAGSDTWLGKRPIVHPAGAGIRGLATAALCAKCAA